MSRKHCMAALKAACDSGDDQTIATCCMDLVTECCLSTSKASVVGCTPEECSDCEAALLKCQKKCHAGPSAIGDGSILRNILPDLIALALKIVGLITNPPAPAPAP